MARRSQSSRPPPLRLIPTTWRVIMIEIGVLCCFRTVRREREKQGSVFLLLFLSDLQSREAMVLCGVFCVFSSASMFTLLCFFSRP